MDFEHGTAFTNIRTSLQPGTHIDNKLTEIPISEFINKELILFSLADNIRSIPQVIDGLKPGQRKVVFGCFKRNLKGEIKVAQLAGYIAEHSAYHHGEAALTSTIVNLAQSFVGANNMNLLEPLGQFGTRLQGGKDAASARYIFTTLSDMTRKVFNASDNALLNYLNDDGVDIEPEWYTPIVPMVLVNGSEVSEPAGAALCQTTIQSILSTIFVACCTMKSRTRCIHGIRDSMWVS